jgi:outer membrane lipoprotein-sorting protein
MTIHDHHRQPARLASPFDGGLLHDGVSAEDQQFATLLATGLGGLREARPDFRDGLERRLLSGHSQPAAPAVVWWRRGPLNRPQTRRRAEGLARLPRRSLIALAAGAAGALLAASLLGPIGGAPEASASEILDLSEARAANPVLAGIKSFHLTATSWGAERPGVAGNVTTEQWFVAPDKMRTETRAKDADGKSIVSGLLSSGSTLKQYATAGANGKTPIGLFMAPIGQKPGGDSAALPAPPPGTGATPPAGAVTRASKPGAGSGEAGVAVNTGQPGPANGERDVMYIAVREPVPNGDGKPKDGETHTIRIGPGCPEPKRTGEEVIAGRQTFKIEHDMSTCLPSDAPAKIPARTVSWVDKATYLPLKLEGYDKTGALVDRYEVSAIEYDITIPDSVFSNLPEGVTVEDAHIRFGPMSDGDGKPSPGIQVSPAPATR